MNNPLKPEARRDRGGPWTEGGLCADPGVDPDLWFSDEKDEIAEAKRICSNCPIQSTCLVKHRESRTGVWGGVDRKRDRGGAA